MAQVNESVWLNAKPEEVWPFIAEPEVRFDIACACVYDGVNA